MRAARFSSHLCTLHPTPYTKKSPVNAIFLAQSKIIHYLCGRKQFTAMPAFKIFISSVQAEFAKERQLIYDFIHQDELLSQYFEPFIFEQISAQNTNPQQLYLDEAARSQVYLLLVGKQYGNAADGELSPTEQEYLTAGEHNAYRIALIKDLEGQPRDEREQRFFHKVQAELSYRIFSNPSVLISLVKQSLYTYLKYKGIIQALDFDEQTREETSMADIDPQKVQQFLHQARTKRGFPLLENEAPATVLAHLRLLRNGVPNNAALLMFAKDPQYFFPTAVIKCAWFLGEEAIKPIEDYKTFDGNIADQINQATSWVISKLSLRYGQRNSTVQTASELEIPRSVIFETIVNAVVHRDYNSKGSVQITVLRNRIVVRNPGTLPVELTKADLLKEHGSYPHNPHLAEVMFQAGYIEKYGTGITENIRKMHEAHLLAPDIDLSAEFVTTIWRDNVATEPSNLATGTPNVATTTPNVATGTPNVATQPIIESKRLIAEIVAQKVKARMTSQEVEELIAEVCIVEHSIDELAILLKKTSKHLRNRFIPNLVADGILLPTKPRHSQGQTYITNPKYNKSTK